MRLFAGGHFFQGTPAPARAFIDTTRASLVREFEQELSRRPRKERKRDPRDPHTLAQHALQPFDSFAAYGDDPVVLTLARVRWWPLTSTGNGLHLPVVRIPVMAVTAWWITGATEVTPDEA